MKSYKEIEKYRKVLTDNSIKCKCGHSIAMKPGLNKEICNWCNCYVFRTPKDEFEYRLKERMIKNARK